MDWLLNHPQVLFVIVIAIVAIVQKLKQARSQDAAGSAPTASQEDAERTRRIQEEIRRRIRERRGLAPAAPPAPVTAGDEPDFPAPPPMIEEVRPVVVKPPPLPVENAAATAGMATEYERQQQMLQQLRSFNAAHQASTAAPPAPVGVVEPVAVSRLPADLRSAAGLRRAILLREILGPPLGMR
jgi:hypothetical protein